MSLSHEDVVRVIQLLDASHFDELSLEIEGVKLNLRRNGAGDRSPAVQQQRAEPSSPVIPTAKTSAQSQLPPAQVQSASADSSLVEIKAPMLGTFYGAPKPGAEPFAAAGTALTENTVIGIIEVMKLMNSVSAGVRGVVVETLVRDGELVEFDQVLMRVRPA